jgi:UDP-N-acetyl-D-glucosamine dehydrogenase
MSVVDAPVILGRIERREARVAVVGLGYVGLPLAVAFAEAGFCVTALEVDEERCRALNQGESYVRDVEGSRVAAVVEAGRLQGTMDACDLRAADAVIICVPTPLNKTHEPDISHVVLATDAVVTNARAGQLVVLESTTYPGTTSELLRPRLEAAGFTLGEDVWLAYSPERIDPGNRDYDLAEIPKVVGGATPRCGEVARALYGVVFEQVVLVSSTETAEMVKLLENTFRMVNIGLVNEFAMWCHQLGVDVWEVIDAAATKPFGFMAFYPGPGLGGHCIPVDPLYLSWKLRGMNHSARFIDLAREINLAMPLYVVSRVTDALNEVGKAVRGSRILVLGVAYKPEVNDVRESPALEIMRLLHEKGARVQYADPFIPEVFIDGMEWRATELGDEALQESDCIVIVTHHSSFPWPRISADARMIVDARNALKGEVGAHLTRL